MSSSRVFISEAAGTDVLEQSDWYRSQSNQRLWERWESSITSTLLQILKSPRSGALCNFKQSELQGVRRVAVAGFPKHLVFYRIQEDTILILRVLHGARDLETLFE